MTEIFFAVGFARHQPARTPTTASEARKGIRSKLMKKLLALAAAFFCTAPAFSGTVVCSGTVTRIAYHTNNTIMLQLSSMNQPVFICNTDAEHTVAGTTFRTGVGMCKALLAVFLSAKATDTTVNNVYFDGDGVPTTCNGWGNWQSAIIRYFDY